MFSARRRWTNCNICACVYMKRQQFYKTKFALPRLSSRHHWIVVRKVKSKVCIYVYDGYLFFYHSFFVFYIQLKIIKVNIYTTLLLQRENDFFFKMYSPLNSKCMFANRRSCAVLHELFFLTWHMLGLSNTELVLSRNKIIWIFHITPIVMTNKYKIYELTATWHYNIMCSITLNYSE